jgi:centromeric protein E
MALTLSPSKQRTLSRQPSSPSLAVGLPPALPESHAMMSSSSSSKSPAKRTRKKPSRRGDVSSSNASSPEASEDEWSMPITPSTSTSNSLFDPETTPKRKVVGILEGSKTQPRKRDNLQARLQAAAKLSKSRSQGEGLAASPSIGHLVPKVKSESIVKSISGAVNHPSTNSKDKVVVCVRYVVMFHTLRGLTDKIRIKPTESTFLHTAYELTQSSLTLSDKHPNVQKRGGKAGREDEYTYNFGGSCQAPIVQADL